MKKILAIAALSVLPCLSQAAVVFSDNFNADGALGLNSTPTGWTVSNGTVDVVGGTGSGAPWVGLCGGGSVCIDLDGSTNNAGELSRSFAGVAGNTYIATFALAGNQRNYPADNLVVSFGTASQTFSLASNVAWNIYSLSFTASTNTNYTLNFNNAGGDNVGIVLDNVSVSAVPEPETYAMLLAGLGLMGTIARRRKSNQA